MSAPIQATLQPERDAWELFRLALPIIGMTISRMAMGFIDFVMVSALGTEAQAAISPATLFVFTLACLGMGVANSVQTFVAQADGRGDPRLAGAYTWQSAYIAALFTLATWPAAATLPSWMTWIASAAAHEPAVAAMEIEYLRYALWSVPPAVLCAGLQGFFNGVQKPRIALFAMLASLIVNAAGNYLLIYGAFGFPEMGIAGAGLATVIGWVVRAAVLLWALLLPEFDAAYQTRGSYAFDWGKLRGIARIGAPTAVMWLLDIGSWVLFLSVIVPFYGKVAMAASNIAQQYMHMAFMPALGIGMALCSQVGYAIGDGRPERAAARTRVAMRMTGFYMGAMGLVFLLAGGPLMRLLTSDPEVIRMGRIVLLWAAIFQVSDAMCITYMNALRGAGDTLWPAKMVAIVGWLVFACGGYSMRYVAPQWGINGPWLTCALNIILIGLLLRRRWLGGAWRSIRLLADDGSGAAAGGGASTEPAAPVAAPVAATEATLAAPVVPRDALLATKIPEGGA